MNPARKRKLAARYRKLVKEYNERIQHYSCGRQLAEHLDKNLATWRSEIEAISVEVRTAIKAGG